MLRSPDLARRFQVANTHSWVANENSDKAIEGITPLISDRAVFQKSFAALPVVTCQAGETVITEGSMTIQPKSEPRAGPPNSVVTKTVSKTEELLAASGASLVYAGYPFDPFA
jgi:hypothetical protein